VKDVVCPYCGEEQEINHDDGYGYEEDELYQQECNCGKTFVYTTAIIFNYDVYKAPCLNGGSHKMRKTRRVPWVIVGEERYRCEYCGEREDRPAPCSKNCNKNKAECWDCEVPK